MPAVDPGFNGGGLGARQPAMGDTTTLNRPNIPGAGDGTYYAPSQESILGAQNYTAAQDAYSKALIRFNQQRQGLLGQYGYKGTVDPTTGLVSNVGVDPNSTYGGLQSLLHDQAIEDQGAKYAAEDRGVFGGLANQAQSELGYSHHAASTQLANNLLANLSDLNSQQADAKSTLDQALWQSQQTAAQDAVAAGDYNPADVPADATAPVAPPAPTSKTTNRVPLATATKIVTAATKAGQPTSEHGLGTLGNTKAAQTAAKVIANAYLTNKNKKG